MMETTKLCPLTRGTCRKDCAWFNSAWKENKEEQCKLILYLRMAGKR